MTGKQLKNSILQWAIQGKLVPQDPNDEPASALLERIRAEKARLIKEKKIKKPKNESIIFRGDDNSHYEKFADGTVRCIDDEIPFEIPQGWCWVRLGSYTDSITDFVASGSFASLRANVKYYSTPNHAILVRTKDLSSEFKGELVYTDEHGYKFLSNSNLYGGELILPNIGASIGKVFIVPNLEQRMTLAPNSVMVRPIEIMHRDWLYYVFSSPFGYTKLWSISASTAQGKFNKTDFKELLIPIPPESEQIRIVSMISRLSPIIDYYSSAQSKLDILNSSIISVLKKSILQEAIQGRLVSQDPNDEPASVLLERIRAEKARLVKEKKIKKDKSESVIFRGDDNCYFEKLSDGTVRPLETPFDIPDNWEWVRLGDLVYNCSGLSYKKEDLEVKHSSPIRVLRGGNIGEGFWLPKDDDVKIAPQFVKPELLLKAGTFITPAVSSYEQVGKTGLIEIDQEDTVVGGFVLMLTPFSSDKSFLRYLLYLFQSPFYKAVCQSMVNKSGQAFYNLSRTKLMNAAIPLPPLKEQCRIVEYLDAAFTHIK